MKLYSTMTDWLIAILNKFISSRIGFLIAFIVPLAVIPMPDSIKQVENILSSNWLQLWALFVLAVIGNKNHQQSKENLEHIKKIHKHLGIKK